jgi:chorismate--pyruvate lyase
LTKPYILSQALKRVCQQFSVKVLEQQFSPIFNNEAAVLGINPTDTAFVRQVFLQDDYTPLTYGRVVVAPVTYDHHFAEFQSLGNLPIGETLLYNNPDVLRSAFEYALIEASSDLGSLVYQHLGQASNTPLWGRRSVFKIKSEPLLVTEVFLPALPDYVP